jgi:hypothetical protein
MTDHNEAGISRSELLLLLGDLHERLDTVFEEIRALPQTTARRSGRCAAPASNRDSNAAAAKNDEVAPAVLLPVA